ERFEVLAQPGRARLLLTARQQRDDAGERAPDRATVPDELDLLLAGPVEDDAPDDGGKVLPRRLEPEAILRGEPGEDGFEKGQRTQRCRRERRGQRRLGSRDDERRIEAPLDPEAGAAGTGAVRAVEGEEPRRQIRIGNAARRARVALAEEERARRLLPRRERLDERRPAAVLDRDRERVGEARLDPWPHDQAIDEHLDRVPCRPGERDLLRELEGLAVDADPHEAAAPELVEHFPVLALLIAHDRRVHEESRVRGEAHELVDDLLHGLRGDLTPALVAERVADAGVEEAEVVRDLRHRADRRTRAAPRPLLLDRDRRREALDRVAVGLRHLLEELAGVRRQRLDVAALALGVQRVERERGLPRPGEPGDHDEVVARDLDVDVLEVVLAGSANDDRARHGNSYPPSSARTAATASSTVFRYSASCAGVSASKRRTSTGCVFDARTRPHPCGKRTRTPSTSMICRPAARKPSRTRSATRNFTSSGQSTRISGVVHDAGRSPRSSAIEFPLRATMSRRRAPA